MNLDRFRFVHRISPLTVALLVFIGAICAAGGVALAALFVRAFGG